MLVSKITFNFTARTLLFFFFHISKEITNIGKVYKIIQICFLSLRKSVIKKESLERVCKAA